ncbi:hypothetical protein FIBSPDRAFT_924758 [Athelia psychrophila]|uniref:Uncharacterized protein n=1 Tax=Athelia psychrophila TaxID=1759441 RepID=A0A166W009_9AGAM|nr:hypothetical protein FIBSPDRAFT_924758 [Fibularhizoctonia sp. CBS 109695]
MSLSAVDLHNSLFNQQPNADIYTTPPRHARHRSSVSSQSSLHPNRGPPPSAIPQTSRQAQKQMHTPAQSFSAPFSQYPFTDPYSPIEEGLDHPDPTYAALLARQPHHPAGPGPGWDMGLSLGGDPPTLAERKDVWEKHVRRRLRHLRATKSVLEVFIGLWALYATVRYLYVYTLYNMSSSAEMLAATLGILSALALALLLIAFILAAFADILVPLIIPLRLHNTRVALRVLASLCVLITAAASLGAVATCWWDADPVWAAPDTSPHPHCGNHGIWLTACLARLIATVVILGMYHYTARAYARTRRPPGISSDTLFNSHRDPRGAYLPSYTVDPDMSFHTMLHTVPSMSTDTQSHTSIPGTNMGGQEVKMTLMQRPNWSATTLVDGNRDLGKKMSLSHTRSRSNSTGKAAAPASPRTPPPADVDAEEEHDTPRARTRKGSNSPVRSRKGSNSPDSEPVIPIAGPSRRTSTVSVMSRLSAYSYPRAWAEYAEGGPSPQGPSPVGSAEDGQAAEEQNAPPRSPYVTGAGWDDFGAPAVLPLPLPQHASGGSHPPSSFPAGDHYTPSYEVDAPMYDYDSGYGGYEHEPDQVRVLGGYIARMPTIASFGSHERGSLASRTPSVSASASNSHSASRSQSALGHLGVASGGNGGSASSRSGSYLSSPVEEFEEGIRPPEKAGFPARREGTGGSSTAGTGSWGRSVMSQSASGTLYEDEFER